MMKIQPRISFSVDSLLGRKTTEIKPRILESSFTDLQDQQDHLQDHRREAEEIRRREEVEEIRRREEGAEIRRREEVEKIRRREEETKEDFKEESESEDDLCVDDEDEDHNSSPSPPLRPHPIMPRPLLGHGMSGLAGLLRPGSWPGHLNLPFSNQSLFDKGNYYCHYYYYYYYCYFIINIIILVLLFLVLLFFNIIKIVLIVVILL